MNANASPKKTYSPMKKAGVLLLKLTVSGSLLYMVLSKAGVGNVLGLLAEIDPIMFALSAGCMVFIILIGSIRWGLLLPDHFPLSRLFNLNMIGAFFNIFLPGLVGGDVLKVYYLYRDTGRGAQAFASVFMDRYLGYAGLMALGAIAFPFGYGYFKGTWITPVLPAILVLFVVVSLFIFVARPGGRFAFIGRLHDHFIRYWGNKRRLVKALCLSMGVHITSCIIVLLVLFGLGFKVAPGAVFVFVPIIATLSALPISISGIGIREAAFVALMGTQGLAPESATAVSFAWFLAIAAGGLPGAVLYLRVRGLRRQKEQ